MTESVIFPNDDTGDALERLYKAGDPLSEPRDIDFTVVFPTQATAAEFAERYDALGLRTEVSESHCQADCPWDVLIVKHMVPSHAEISVFEDELESAAAPLGGRNDGWGCFSLPTNGEQMQ
ncbi:MAG TPA: ribonuclease E inhibitor RraB [Terracidiphilus sp.]|nr:ribonuclease E inhibitor RraB [Terracidiphilus sp.]